MPNSCRICNWSLDLPGGKFWCHHLMKECPADHRCQEWEAKPMRDFGPPEKKK